MYKDFQKLLREPLWGLWFHLLESVDKSTINNLLSVMAKEIGRVRRKFREDIKSPGLSIHICVLQHKFSIQRDLHMDAGARFDGDLEAQLHFELEVSRSELLRVNDRNGWDVHLPAN